MGLFNKGNKAEVFSKPYDKLVDELTKNCPYYQGRQLLQHFFKTTLKVRVQRGLPDAYESPYDKKINFINWPGTTTVEGQPAGSEIAGVEIIDVDLLNGVEKYTKQTYYWMEYTVSVDPKNQITGEAYEAVNTLIKNFLQQPDVFDRTISKRLCRVETNQ